MQLFRATRQKQSQRGLNKFQIAFSESYFILTSMKKVIAFGGSNSKNSINKKLASHAAGQLQNVEVQVLDLNDFEMPIFSIDREEGTGIPEQAHSFLKLIQDCDGIILSLAEHNGSYSVAFKNVFDWVSRIDYKVWSGKPMLLLSTSPGARGGQTVLESAKNSFPRLGADLVGAFSLPSFNEHFSDETGISDPSLSDSFSKELSSFSERIKSE